MHHKLESTRKLVTPLLRFVPGFGLIDLITTLAITALLISMIRSTAHDVIDNVRVSTAASQLYSAIGLTRAEAMKRGERVDLIFLQGKNFTRGWVVLIDRNANHVADTGEVILLRSAGLPENLEIRAQLRDHASPYLAFDPSGRPRSNASSEVPQIGSLLLTVGKKKRKLIMAFLGRVRVCDPDKSASTC